MKPQRFAVIVALLASPAFADLIASSTFTGTIHRIKPNGQVTTLWSGIDRPHEVEVDRFGNILIAELGTSPDRIIRTRIGQPLTTLYAFDSLIDNPEGLAVGYNGIVYTAGTIDHPLRRVYRIHQDGRAYWYGTGPLNAMESLSCAMDSIGNLYVTDLNSGSFGPQGRLWKIAPNEQITLAASGLGKAVGVTVAPDGQTVLVSDASGNKIRAVSPSGQVSDFASIQFPWAMTFDDVGNLFVGQLNTITKIAPDGSQSIFASSLGFNEIRGLAFMPDFARAPSKIAAVPEPKILMPIALVALASLRGQLKSLRSQRR